MNKKIWIPLVIVLAIAGLFLIGRFGLKLGSWEYNSYGEFISNSSPLRLSVSIPEGASDQRFYCNNTLILIGVLLAMIPLFILLLLLATSVKITT